MAITITDRIEERQNQPTNFADNATTCTTSATLTPTSGSNFVAVVYAKGNSGNGADGTLSGACPSWTLVTGNSQAGATTRFMIFVGAGDGSGASALTYTRGGSHTFDYITICVYEVTGCVATIGANGAGMLITANTVTQNASTSDPIDKNYNQAWASGSAGFAAWVRMGGNVASTPRSGWTERYDLVSSGANEYTLAIHSRLDVDTAFGADWTGTDAGIKAGIGIEIAAAATGGGGDRGTGRGILRGVLRGTV